MFRKTKYKFHALKYGIRDNKKKRIVYYNVRRNIHRIEKGLSYSNRKKVFAEAYIRETVENLKNLFESSAIDSNTKKWSISVLKQYFEVVDSKNLIVKKAKLEFDKLPIDKNENYDNYPYDLDKRIQSKVDYDALYELSMQRRSVRSFKDIRVSKETLEKVFDIAKLSPSACNRQSFKYLFFNEPKVVQELAQIPGGVSGYQLYNIVVVIGDYSGYFDERDINVPIIDASLASMSFLYACETVGLSTVCINWPNLPDREKAIRKKIEIKKSEFVVMLIGIGYAADSGKILYSTKRGNEDFLFLNERLKSRNKKMDTDNDLQSLCD